MRGHAHDIAGKLGADRTFRVKGKGRGPLSWLQLCEEVAERLRSTGGRPSDPNWSFRRQIPFQKRTWEMLAALSRALKQRGTAVEPGQIAAILLEHQLQASSFEQVLNEVYKSRAEQKGDA